MARRSGRARLRRARRRPLTDARRARGRAAEDLGRAGEDVAAAHLEAAGYRVLARRWRAAGCEVDLVVERDRIVGLVEVKTRSPRALAPPATAVDGRKRARLVRAAAVAVERWGDGARGFRFDVVTVVWGREGPEVEHLVGAFRAGP